MNKTTKTANKGLYGLLAMTLVITLWTAFDNETAQYALSDTSIHLVQPAKATIDEINAPRTPRASGEISVNKIVNKFSSTDLQQAEKGQLFSWAALNREASIDHIQDIFKSHSWLVVPPPPPPVEAAPPPPPQAPPAPFQYVGKMENNPNTGKIFLIQHNQFYYVSKGENINKEWRLDREEANVLRLTYLPLNLPQVLIKSAKQPLPTPEAEAVFEPN